MLQNGDHCELFPIIAFSTNGLMVRILFSSTFIHRVYQELLIRFGSFGKVIECILSIHRCFARCEREEAEREGVWTFPWADIETAALLSVSEDSSH